MGLRFAAGTDALAALVRERQDLSAFWRGLDKALIEALAKPEGQGNAARIEAIRKQVVDTESALAANATRLAAEFPEYAALANPKPLNAEEVQNLLGPQEGLVFFLTGDKESYVFALTREAFEWKTIPLGAAALSEKVTAFRRGLDVDALRRGLQRLECTQAEADKRGLARADCAPVKGPRELFDLGLAHELYGTLIGPVEALVREKRHLIVVSSGALTALPFHLLVMEKPAVAVPQVKTPRDLAAYRDAAWLLKRHAVSVLPSVASLKALRVFARKDEAKSPLIGFGDPVFNAEEESRPGAQDQSVVATRSYTEFWKGVDIDRSMLSKALLRLPETDGRVASGRGKSWRTPKQHPPAPGRQRDARSSGHLSLITAWSISPPMVSLPARSRGWRSPRSRSRCRSSRARPMTASSLRVRWRSSSSTRTGWCSPPATPSPATSLARKHCRGWRVRSSTPAPALFWSRIGRWRPMRRSGSQHRRSMSSSPIRPSAAPRRCAAR